MSAKQQINQSEVIMKAYMNACKAFGFSDQEKSRIIGVSRPTLSRAKHGFDPNSKTYELQLTFIRLYRSLYALVGGDNVLMKEWLNDYNHALHSIPRDLCFSIIGLVSVNEYLDAMRGKL